MRGPIVLGRYYKSDAAGADGEGWFSTGDVANIDPAGHMQITDRSKGGGAGLRGWLAARGLSGGLPFPELARGRRYVALHAKKGSSQF